MNKNRKGIAMITIVAILMSIFVVPANAAGNVVITAGTVTGAPGDTVVVSINLEQNSGCIGVQIDTSFDSNVLELVAVTDTGLFPGQNHQQVEDGANSFRLTWENDTVENNITVTGEIAQMQFKILDTAEAGMSYPIELSIPVHGVMDVDMGAVEAAVTNGAVVVEEEDVPPDVPDDQILGDINLDGELDIRDATLLFNHSMLPNRFPIAYTGDIDFNEDGTIDIRDATLLFNHSMLPNRFPLFPSTNQ